MSNIITQRRQLFNLGSISDSPRLQELVERADTLSEARVAVYNASGMLLADSRRESELPLPEWSYFAERRANAAPVVRDPNGRQWLYVLNQLADGSKLLLTAPRPRLAVRSVLREEFLAPFLRGALLALGLTVLLAVWIAQWISAPLQRLEEATRQVPSEVVQKIPLKGPREVQALAQSFNEMADSLQLSQRSQRDFIANISHDLKTPLTSIQGFAQAILDGTAEDLSGARKSAQVIFEEAGRMNRMVMELLDLARLDAGTLTFDLRPVDIGVLLHKVVEKFTPQARQAQVSLHLDPPEPGEASAVIMADEDRLAQVFSNLIDNALKYTPGDGLISLSAHLVNGWVEVKVADTGSGIAPNELDRIFERFYQTDKARSGGIQRGLGLGLAIAREIVLAHGGTVSAHNRAQMDQLAQSTSAVAPINTGSIFVVRLPLERYQNETPVRKLKETSFRSNAGA